MWYTKSWNNTRDVEIAAQDRVHGRICACWSCPKINDPKTCGCPQCLVCDEKEWPWRKTLA